MIEEYRQFGLLLAVSLSVMVILLVCLWREERSIKKNLHRISAFLLFLQAPIVVGVLALQSLELIKVPGSSSTARFIIYAVSMLGLTVGLSIRYQRKRVLLAVCSVAVILLNLSAALLLWVFGKLSLSQFSGPEIFGYLMFLDYLILFVWSQCARVNWHRYPRDLQFFYRLLGYAALWVIVSLVPASLHLAGQAPGAAVFLAVLVLISLGWVASSALRVTS